VGKCDFYNTQIIWQAKFKIHVIDHGDLSLTFFPESSIIHVEEKGNKNEKSMQKCQGNVRKRQCCVLLKLNDPTWSASLRGVSGTVVTIIHTSN